MMDKNSLMTHIKSHVDYPTTKKALVEACNNMSDIADEDKKWFSDTLPEGEYKKPGDVMKTLEM